MIHLSGLYAITSADICSDPDRLQASVTAAIAGGARLIQYRDKAADAVTRRERASGLRALCAAGGVLFIVNDDMQLAAEIGADGVHLGRDDGAIGAARRLLGDTAVIGVSCSGSLERAQSAVAEGASYVAFGRFFDSRTKPDAPPASPGLLIEARAALRLPICAIGGITPAHAPALIAAGADMIAAVEGVFGAGDIRAAAARYAACFKKPLA